MEPPGTEEKAIRFGCGFAAGAFLAAFGGLAYLLGNGRYWLALVVGAGVLAGWAAMRYGDAFWERVRWWWW